MYKVLIADDESIIRRGLKSIIDWKASGFEICAEAANGSEALHFIEENPVDLILMDIKMPKLHGLDALKAAREAGFTGKFIILSGFSDFHYAQTAIPYGIVSYLTKPVDIDALLAALLKAKQELDAEATLHEKNQIYASIAREGILRDLMSGKIASSEIHPATAVELGLDQDIYQVITYEKYSYNLDDVSYNFTDLLRVTNIRDTACDSLLIGTSNVLLLKGKSAIDKFNNVIGHYEKELPPEKNSPLDSIFITCGRTVCDLSGIALSYSDAVTLLEHRFFCDESQHVMTPESAPKPTGSHAYADRESILGEYTDLFVGHIQSFNRNRIAESLTSLRSDLYHAPFSIDEEKNLLIDLYLRIKEKLFSLYPASQIPFIANSEAVHCITHSYYLYEIITFLSEQFDMIMSTIGYASKDSIIDDIVHYIDHNYSENITLEKISPLFGYNSSYLGKIFNKKMNVNFNTYLDQIRIEHSKDLLKNSSLQVYRIAEAVGYRNVDYFHIKFKKYTGSSPAEYRKANRREEG